MLIDDKPDTPKCTHPWHRGYGGGHRECPKCFAEPGGMPPTANTACPITDDEREAYRDHRYECPVPGVPHGGWSDEDWIRHIRVTGRFLPPPTPVMPVDPDDASMLTLAIDALRHPKAYGPKGVDPIVTHLRDMMSRLPQ